MNDNQKSDVIEKIEKLVRAAKDLSNPAEAETTMRKAIALATKHDIDLSQIKSDGEKESIVKHQIEAGQRSAICQRFVNSILENFFKVKILKEGGRAWGITIHFIGKAEDIKLATFLNEYLKNTFMECWHSHKERTGAHTKMRESYMMGLYRGLYNKLEEAKSEVLTTLDSQTSQTYALSVISEKKRLELAVSNFFPKVTYTKEKTVEVYPDSYQAGIKDGKNIQISEGRGLEDRRYLS